jgi:hypothetical protein
MQISLSIAYTSAFAGMPFSKRFAKFVFKVMGCSGSDILTERAGGDAPKRDNQTLDDWVKVYLPCSAFMHEKGGEKAFRAPGIPRRMTICP